MQLTRESIATANSRIIFIDHQNEISSKTRESISKLLKESYTKKVMSRDIIFYLMDENNSERLEAVKSQLQSMSSQSHFLIVSKTPLHNGLISYLSLSISGIVSLDFLEKNTSIVIKSLMEKGIFLDPDFHKDMVCEIEKRQKKDAPIKKFVLNEKAGEVLSQKEQEVLQLILDGNNNIKIAEKLFFAQSTINSIISRLLKKLDANDRTDAVIKIIRSGWVDAIR
ncbi:two-component system response regulator DegU [Evansella vedderi]|uniref:Two-component system response regulator DegU n=1 Tax=Evansella vedderi TaxID=38282 RepID=A0ABT9ZSX2_9BACI|nr:LuxR C-terminal-related transcriptional regulator [Evansella vedderi]MDQ0253583.1 two-component system response regulator DegU [Evansella vedderi]